MPRSGGRCTRAGLVGEHLAQALLAPGAQIHSKGRGHLFMRPHAKAMAYSDQSSQAEEGGGRATQHRPQNHQGSHDYQQWWTKSNHVSLANAVRQLTAQERPCAFCAARRRDDGAVQCSTHCSSAGQHSTAQHTVNITYVCQTNPASRCKMQLHPALFQVKRSCGPGRPPHVHKFSSARGWRYTHGNPIGCEIRYTRLVV